MRTEAIAQDHSRRARLLVQLRAIFLVLVRGGDFFGSALAGFALLLVPLLVPAMVLLGLGTASGLPGLNPRAGFVLALFLWAGDAFLVRYGLLGALLGIRRLAQRTRRLSDEWLRIPIRSSYMRSTDQHLAGLSLHRLRWMLSDSATWWDILWAFISFSFGWLLTVLPLALALMGLIGCVGYGIVGMLDGSVLGRGVLGLVGAALAVLALWSAPLLLQTY
ncbi:MAG TPA: sensor domain-containing protein, partial [Acidimicrobiales bacterium]|nr:sensor domain-containing protein [Acidimicrobiales bacterium]